ncbi:hypothetical protein RS694_02945 [Rhodoferax saidenbachensis]|uniref:Aminoglycoside phosphotransferase domain-containing protein n=2 Tax=Rhodoferax saidenbachensis TaxID=1484693 RepID=A0A1P8KF46_9BURK|nr:hypothetical protein RS694_02945 [Rhodoferax saidenbachensis]
MDARIAKLLAAMPVGAVRSVAACASSGNNRTYKVQTEHRTLAVKQYFRHGDDTRDRLGTEFGFLSFAAQAAPGCAPAPLSMDCEESLAAYEFVEGRALAAAELQWTHVQAAIDFFLALNTPQARLLAKDLPPASEACFSVAGHLELVGRRVAGLAAGIPDTVDNSAAVALVQQLKTYWDALASRVLESAVAPDVLLAPAQRCLSPSDFGFHNALLQADQRLRFLDFEYAGWDDPAKLVGDFFAQLAVPVPAEYFDRFVAAIAAAFTDPQAVIARANLLRPVYQVKWCCIALNVFLPTHLARRQFANPGMDKAILQRRQVAKAQSIFQSLPTL